MSGLLAAFESAPELSRALARFPASEWGDIETFTPVPMEGESVSPLPSAMFAAGMLGFVGFFALMSYADVHAYPVNIGGRPRFAWPTFIPIAFELGVLCAMLAGFIGFFVVCRLPKLYDPIDSCESSRRALRDGWLLAIRREPAQRIAEARSLLEELGPTSIEEFSDE